MDKFQNDRHFEERIVQALIVDHPFAEQMAETLNIDYFNLDYLRTTAKLIFDYYGQYKTFPSFRLLVHIVKSDLKDELLKDQIIAFFTKIQQQPLNGDLEYIKESSLDFCKKRRLAIALENSLSFIEEKKYEQISHEIQKALQAGSERDVGHMFFEDFEKRMTEVKRNPVGTAWGEVNRYLKGGGVSGGELCVVCAPTGVGKSHCLVDLGCAAAMAGKNVVHYTLELSDVEVGNRYDARLSGIPPEQLRDHKERVREAISKVPGKIVIKAYPTDSVSVLSIKNHLHKLAMKDIRPDVIIIDYADLMKSGKNYDARRFEEESIYRELRAFSQECQIPIWTATQSNRAGLDEEILTLKHIAECFAKAQISDLFITMTRKKENSFATHGNFFIAKSRLGPDGIKLPIVVNTSISKIEVLTPDALEQELSSIESSTEQHLKARFKQLKMQTSDEEIM